MPFVMLKKNWPGVFRRTITTGKKGKESRRTLVFTPGVPVDLTASEVDALLSDIGSALLPIEFDEKNRPRVITGDVVPDDSGVKESESSELAATH